jgi:DNA-binding NarL/FixJ family response regulator
MDGIAATQALKARWPDSQVVILTTFDDVELISAGLRAGALGYLLKDVTAEQLADTVRVAARGDVLLQPEIASKVFATLLPTPPPSGQMQVSAASSPASSKTVSSLPYGEQLTEREHEILTMVAQGASNREIGERLFITEGTVKNHLSNILSKMGVRDRTQAALKARELGLA